MATEIQKQREALVERLGVFVEQKDQIPPLAARIIATLILSGKKGCTFDDLVTSLQASKSTISTHLNSLQQAERITYFTVCGDRKKYFVTNPKSLLINLDERLKTWEREQQLHKEVMDYKKTYNELHSDREEQVFDLEFHLDYIEYLEQAQNSIKKIREKVTEKLKHE
ncbi:MAG: transcriptional regulator [Leeuwenhoekiella sp.]|nr:MAG: transcriptional regulator [Leeuwenhoekiella sp.]